MAHPDSVSVSEVRALLEARRTEWADIAKAAKVDLSWIYKFMRGDIENPGYLTLCKLHTSLTREQGQPAAAKPAEA